MSTSKSLLQIHFSVKITSKRFHKLREAKYSKIKSQYLIDEYYTLTQTIENTKY